MILLKLSGSDGPSVTITTTDNPLEIPIFSFASANSGAVHRAINPANPAAPDSPATTRGSPATGKYKLLTASNANRSSIEKNNLTVARSMGQESSDGMPQFSSAMMLSCAPRVSCGEPSAEKMDSTRQSD